MSGTTRILPGATIGILGGGQLGRMTGIAARTMGYDVHIFDPDPNCSAAVIASRLVTAPYDDERAAAAFAESCAVVTLEIEQVSTTTLNAAARFAPVRPSAEPIHIVQDRGRQKAWLHANHFPLGPFRICDDEAALLEAVTTLAPCIVKSAHGGYDGRGQVRCASAEDGVGVWQSLGSRRVVVEQLLSLAFEISVMTARAPDGHLASFPAAWNHHDHGILTWSMSPAPIDPALATQARALAQAITTTIGMVGLLAVELFMTTDGQLLVNELAPRPHNTFHQTERGNDTSQFEQLVRAVCGLPLGSPEATRPAAIHNLLGDLWIQPGRTPQWLEPFGIPGVRVHLYGKPDARAGRKMGHLSATGSTPEMARDLVKAAYRSVARSVGLAD